MTILDGLPSFESIQNSKNILPETLDEKNPALFKETLSKLLSQINDTKAQTQNVLKGSGDSSDTSDTSTNSFFSTSSAISIEIAKLQARSKQGHKFEVMEFFKLDISFVSHVGAINSEDAYKEFDGKLDKTHFSEEKLSNEHMFDFGKKLFQYGLKFFDHLFNKGKTHNESIDHTIVLINTIFERLSSMMEHRGAPEITGLYTELQERSKKVNERMKETLEKSPIKLVDDPLTAEMPLNSDVSIDRSVG